jgi:hypothetical protein
MKKNLPGIVMVIFFSPFLKAQQPFAKAEFIGPAAHLDISLYGNSLIYRDTTFTKEYYWEKSKNQKTAAWVMLGGGVGLSIVGIIGLSANYNLFVESTAADTYATLTLIGTGLSLGSIPLFIASGRNARKAIKLSYKTQPVFLPQQNGSFRKTQAAISVQIPL